MGSFRGSKLALLTLLVAGAVLAGKQLFTQPQPVEVAKPREVRRPEAAFPISATTKKEPERVPQPERRSNLTLGLNVQPKLARLTAKAIKARYEQTIEGFLRTELHLSDEAVERFRKVDRELADVVQKVSAQRRDPAAGPPDLAQLKLMLAKRDELLEILGRDGMSRLDHFKRHQIEDLLQSQDKLTELENQTFNPLRGIRESRRASH